MMLPPADAWHVAPEEAGLLAGWLRCVDLWLASIERRSGSVRSRQAYERGWLRFFRDAHDLRLAPWQVTPTDAQVYVAALAGRLAPATINKLVSVLASFYAYAGAYAVDHGPAGARLWPHDNPFAARSLRTRVSRFGRSAVPTAAQVTSLLDHIDTSSAEGLRDRAIIYGMFQTTRRLSEWLHLRWGDITGETFVCRIKGNRLHRQKMTADLRHDIEQYLIAADHWPPAPADFLFVALRSGAWTRPLCQGQVNRIIRKYGRLAGVPAELCHAHGLRHAGARERRRRGASAWQLQMILGHQSVATTEIYIREVLDEPEDELGSIIDEAFRPRSYAVLPRARM